MNSLVFEVQPVNSLHKSYPIASKLGFGEVPGIQLRFFTKILGLADAKFAPIAVIWSIMELLNLAFVILLVKLAICVLPGVFGIFLFSITEEKKREFRNSLCNRLFGVSNAIPYPNFERVLLIIGILSILFSAGASWFLLIAGMIK